MTSSRPRPFGKLLIALLIALPVYAQALRSFEAVEPHMGTLFRIKLYAADEAQAQSAFRAAFARITELDNTLSDYQPDSELDRIAQTAVHRPVRVSDDLFRVAAAAQQLSEETHGAFDITVGPLTHLWREARKNQRLPDEEKLAEARARCGYRKLHLDAVAHTMEFDRSGMQLDAGAIAKGDAADQAILTLEKRGIRSALVAASGDLAFSDAPPGEHGWKVGIDSLDNARVAFTKVVVLKNKAVSTSGPSEQHLDADGLRYSHIINPLSGFGLTREITASVTARHGIDADSFSTAVSVLGVQRGIEFIEKHPGASVLIVAEVNGQKRVIESK